jgi:hypothetical protein
METLDAQILSLTEQDATAVLELVLRRSGLTSDPFAADHPHDQLRAALHHPDLLSTRDIPAQPPSDGSTWPSGTPPAVPTLSTLWPTAQILI